MQKNPLRSFSLERTMRRRGSSSSIASEKPSSDLNDGFRSDSGVGVGARALSPGRSGSTSGDRWKRLFTKAASARSPTRSAVGTPPVPLPATATTSTFTPSSPSNPFASFTTAIPSSSTQKAGLPAMTDFLSRESEVLGDDFSSFTTGGGSAGGTTEIDFDRAASAFPDINLDNLDEPVSIPAVVSPPATNSFDIASFGDFGTSVGSARGRDDVKVTGDDEIEKFEDQFPELDEGNAVETFSPVIPQQPTFSAPPPFAPKPQPSAFSSTPILTQPIQDEEEPEVIKAWREKQAEEIKKRDEASAARRQEIITKAERSIDQFYEDYNSKKERNIKENKLQEADYLASFSDSLSAGTTWSRICSYIELENSQSKTLARTGAGTTDLTRFKDVLLRLKREGDAAPGAAGY